jgi:hypothetical protein
MKATEAELLDLLELIWNGILEEIGTMWDQVNESHNAHYRLLFCFSSQSSISSTKNLTLVPIR